MTGRPFRGNPAPWIIEHVDGVAWYEAPPPPAKHEHWAQTTGTTAFGLELVERCPCGAIRTLGGPKILAEWGYIPPDKPRVIPTPTLLQRLAGIFAGRK